MATPRDDVYSVASGEVVYGGRLAPSQVPAWRVGQAVGEWREIAGSAMSLAPATNPDPQTITGGNAMGGPSAAVETWTGQSIDTRTNRVICLRNGGHADSFFNGVRYLELNSDSPAWVEVLPQSTGMVVYNETSTRASRYSDDRPASVHGYYGQHVIERHNRAVSCGGSISALGSAYQDVESWDLSTPFGVDGFDRVIGKAVPSVGVYPPVFGADGYSGGTIAWAMCKNPITEQLYAFSTGPYPTRRFTPSVGGPDGTEGSGGVWENFGPGNEDLSQTGYEAASAYDTKRNRCLMTHGLMNDSTASTSPAMFDVEAGGAWVAGLQFSGAGKAGLDALMSCPGMVYEPNTDAYYLRGRAGGPTVYKIDAGTLEVTVLATTGGNSIQAFPVGDTKYEMVHTNWLLAPSLGGIIYIPAYASNAWFLRLY